MDPSRKNIIRIVSFLSVILFCSFIIGLTIPYLESHGKIFMGIELIPLLLIIIYVIVDNFYKMGRTNHNSKEETINGKRNEIKPKKPMIVFNGRSYFFSLNQILMLILGTPLLSLILFFFFSLDINFWINEITTKQVSFFLKLLFRIDSQVIVPRQINTAPYIHFIKQDKVFNITTACLATHVYSIFIGIILCIPNSKNEKSKVDFKWRKTITFIFSIIMVYILNLIRLVVLFFTIYQGIPWEFIHETLFYLSAVIAGIIFIIFLRKWMPEFFISIYYMYVLAIHKKNKKIDFK